MRNRRNNNSVAVIIAIIAFSLFLFFTGCTPATVQSPFSITNFPNEDSTDFTDTSDISDIADYNDINDMAESATHRPPNANSAAYSKSVQENENTSDAQIITPLNFLLQYSPDFEFEPQQEKAHTIMIYMNGSDLESEYESATDDLYEMFASNFDSDNINLLIFTGGTNKWHTRIIPNRINAIFKIEHGELIKLAEVGKNSTGSPEVLSGFINFCYDLFPAQQYGLIFWNHGGGAVIGYGSDERYEHDPSKAMMRLNEIDSAFASTNFIQDGQILEFIGFDTCLMATLEMACIAGKYAKYMIASEELEPGPGWDYRFLDDITPDSSGYDIGIAIIDYYEAFYLEAEIEDITTLSMTDLSKIQSVADAFEDLAVDAGNALADGQYNTISKARSNSRMFGSYGEHGGESDMIDAAHLAESLRELLPEKSDALLTALEEAVVYKHENNVEPLGGLSIYFPFTNKEDVNYYIEIYKSINQLPNYTAFIEDFSYILTSRPFGEYRSIKQQLSPAENEYGERCYSIMLTPEQLENLSEAYFTVWEEAEPDCYIQLGKSSKINIGSDGVITTDPDKSWTTLNGRKVCLYEIARSENRARYAIPVKLNGKDADLIAVYSEKYPNGKIIGAVPAHEDVYNVLNKKMVGIKSGDSIAVLYYATDIFSEYKEDIGSMWYESDEFIVTEDFKELELKKENKDIAEDSGKYIYGVNLVDTQQNDTLFILQDE